MTIRGFLNAAVIAGRVFLTGLFWPLDAAEALAWCEDRRRSAALDAADSLTSGRLR